MRFAGRLSALAVAGAPAGNRIRFCFGRPLFMIRVPMIALLLIAGLAGCANDPSGHHGGPPPRDPADYHGVPTDTRPPTMVPAPVTP
jgi:hypothetical protein